ncbi:hypothetical protein BOO86_04715 [Mycobacterium sp. CBMA 234]|nr:hypothetical protein [Mycolicibacterium sp. CBMA 234]
MTAARGTAAATAFVDAVVGTAAVAATKRASDWFTAAVGVGLGWLIFIAALGDSLDVEGDVVLAPVLLSGVFGVTR